MKSLYWLMIGLTVVVLPAIDYRTEHYGAVVVVVCVYVAGFLGWLEGRFDK